MNNDIYNWPGWKKPEQDDDNYQEFDKDNQPIYAGDDENSEPNSEAADKRDNSTITIGNITITPVEESGAPTQPPSLPDPEHPLRRSSSSHSYDQDHFLAPDNNRQEVNFNTVGIVLFVALIVYFFSNPGYLFFYICLAVNVLLHEIGHYAAGRIFKCMIREVSLFFLPAISYCESSSHNNYDPDYYSWRDTKWTLGVLPLGGYTTFLNSSLPPQDGDHRRSPFVNHKPAWQRLIINIAGILVNLLIYGVCYAYLNVLSPSSPMPLIETIMNLALALAVFNLLPFYPLDGGAALVTIFEMITGKEPSRGFMYGFRILGIGLFVYFFFINPSVIYELMDMVGLR